MADKSNLNEQIDKKCKVNMLLIYILSTSCRAGDGKAAVENDQRQDIKI